MVLDCQVAAGEKAAIVSTLSGLRAQEADGEVDRAAGNDCPTGCATRHLNNWIAEGSRLGSVNMESELTKVSWDYFNGEFDPGSG